jgi:hypothetical protein
MRNATTGISDPGHRRTPYTFVRLRWPKVIPVFLLIRPAADGDRGTSVLRPIGQTWDGKPDLQQRMCRRPRRESQPCLASLTKMWAPHGLELRINADDAEPVVVTVIVVATISPAPSRKRKAGRNLRRKTHTLRSIAISQAPSHNYMRILKICRLDRSVPISQAPRRNFMVYREIRRNICLSRLLRRPA